MLVMQYIQYCGIGIGTRLESLVHVHETIIIWRETEIAGPYFADSAQKEAAVDALYLELYILHFTPANHANDAEMNVQEGDTKCLQDSNELPNDTTSSSKESPVEQSITDAKNHGEGSDKRKIVLPFTTSVVPDGMTKRQWKKHICQQKKMIRHEESKILKKEKLARRREEKRKEKEQALKEGRPWPPKRKRSDVAADVALAPSAKKFKMMSSSDASPFKVVIDFGFEDLMTDKDIKMLMKQCQRCYSQNRRATSPLQFYWTNFGGRSQKRLASVMAYQNWDVHMRSHGYIEEFGKENVVFLTSDSPHVLTELDPSKAYIIGGLVDHNHHKGYCLKHAVEQGIAHAQLPILEYIKLNSRTVLAVNHVFEILLAFAQNKDWKKSFYEVIPPRKVASDDSNCDVSGIDVESRQSTVSAEELDRQSATPQTPSCQSRDVSCSESENESEEAPTLVQIQKATEASTGLSNDSHKETSAS